jgi:hypothetical protein
MVINTTTASSQHRDDHCGLSRLTATAMPIDYAAHDAINELSRQHSTT